MDTAISLYQYIADSVDEETGGLPPYFRLPRRGDGNSFESMWADGAMDGVSIYHVAEQEVPEQAISQVRAALRCASEEAFDKAEELLAQAGAQEGAVNTVGALEALLGREKILLDMDSIYAFACHMAAASGDRECVKYAICLLGLFPRTEHDKTARGILETLALSDEFAGYVVQAAESWEDGNDVIFRVAQKTSGWGRVHAMEKLEPQTQEIQEWLWQEAPKGDLYMYYAAKCLYASNARDRIRDKLTDREFDAMCCLMRVLLEPSPFSSGPQCDGEFMLLFLGQCEHRALSAEQYYVLDRMYDAIRTERRKLFLPGDGEGSWYVYTDTGSVNLTREEYDRYCDSGRSKDVLDAIRGTMSEEGELALQRCEAMFHTDEFAEVVRNAVREGEYWVCDSLADPYHVPYMDILREQLCRDVQGNCAAIDVMFDAPPQASSREEDRPMTIGELLDVLRVQMPPDRLDAYNETWTDWNGEVTGNYTFYRLASWLKEYPVGLDYVEAALRSGEVYNRSVGLEIVSAWTGNAQKPLSELSEELYRMVGELVPALTDEEDLRCARLLLEGVADVTEAMEDDG